MRTRKSKATRVLEELAGGPLSFGRNLRSIREGEEVSQVEFASRLGISRSHLCDIEKSRKLVSAARAAEMARMLGYSERQFVQLALQEAMERAGLHYKVTIEAA
jgi:transcriptional regulator with XRE-family HTH domain